MPDKWAQYAVPADKWAQYAQPAASALPAGATGPLPGVPAAPVPAGLQGPPAPTLKPGLGATIAEGAGDVGMGMLKGALNTATALPAYLAQKTGYANPQKIAERQRITAPSNTAQSVGKSAEQIGEFFLPGLGEEKAAAAGAKALPIAESIAKPLTRLAYQAGTTGAVNAAQGGSFKTGAETGLAGGVAGEAFRAAAPYLAESALNIRKLDRAYGKGGGAIGRTILDETKGAFPGTVAASAQDRLGQLNPQLEALANAATAPADLTPARQALSDAAGKAAKQGERTTLGQLSPMVTHLQETIGGAPIPQNIMPADLLDLKRGFGNEFIHRWNPETMEGVKGTAAQTYHAMGDAFNNAVPGAAELNGRMSRLIPIAKRGESAELNAPTLQRITHRVAAHTGALTGSVVGGLAGYREDGVPGAIGYGALGLVAPEVLASPTAQMFFARRLNSGVIPRVLTGAGLQFDRDTK